MKKSWKRLTVVVTMLCLVTLTSCSEVLDSEWAAGGTTVEYSSVLDVPEYEREPYVEINGNTPDFTEAELTTEAYETYSKLDSLGRCGEAEACIGEELMPTGERESISEVKPTGWKNEKYDSVDGGYLYNRCHLIGYQLSGENANEENLITGTRYMNVEGMLPFEDMVADYVHETKNHVMYRVTPIFEGDDLVASGVQMEAESVEDDGEGISFNVYVYNVQPDITIDYATGDNWETSAENAGAPEDKMTYILNTNTHKFHLPDCAGAADMMQDGAKKLYHRKQNLFLAFS